jgi:hypothetical protein
VEGAVHLPPGCYLDASGQTVRMAEEAAAQMVLSHAQRGATSSADGRNGGNPERTARPVAPPSAAASTAPVRPRTLGGFGRRRVFAQVLKGPSDVAPAVPRGFPVVPPIPPGNAAP